MKTAYIAAHHSLKKDIERIHSKLEKLGYLISNDEEKDYDLFIILANRSWLNINSKIADVISHHLEFKKPIIYSIGKNKDNPDFFYHPVIRKKNTIEEVLKELKGEKII